MQPHKGDTNSYGSINLPFDIELPAAATSADGRLYDLSGRRVAVHTAHGIYVTADGRKVVVR